MKTLSIKVLIVTVIGALAMSLGPNAVISAGTNSERLDIATATPIQLGTRYGQAAGIALLCYGLKVSPDAEKLKSRFSGTELDSFNKQASKILAAWEKTLKCENAGGPNECKLSHTWSCQQGLKELGPKGTILPGLVEQRVK